MIDPRIPPGAVRVDDPELIAAIIRDDDHDPIGRNIDGVWYAFKWSIDHYRRWQTSAGPPWVDCMGCSSPSKCERERWCSIHRNSYGGRPQQQSVRLRDLPIAEESGPDDPPTPY